MDRGRETKVIGLLILHITATGSSGNSRLWQSSVEAVASFTDQKTEACH